jgi:hypothetical protein
MNWQDKYLCPLINREKISRKKASKIIKDFFILLLHAISFHEQPKEQPEQLPDFVSQDVDTVYSVCREFYNNANERIDKIEDKAIKLLPYVSALFAFISFIFINTSFFITKVLLIISMGLLVTALLISFRCVSVKGRKTFFLPDIYNFDKEIPEENFDKKILAKKLLNSAIFNQNVADNIADILKAARNVIALALIICTAGFFFSINGYIEQVSTVKVKNQIDLIALEEKLENTNELLEQINLNLSIIGDQGDLKRDIFEIKNQIESIKNDYNSLIKKGTD